MVKELYQIIQREVCLNVNVGRVDSVRTKNLTRSGCRVYKDGFIGVAGCLGEPTEETWAEAERALERKLPSQGAETGTVRRRENLGEALTAQEFLRKTEELLAVLEREFPDYVLSNKVIMQEEETRLKNDAGLDLTSINRIYSLSLVVKQKGSPNVFDTFVAGVGRSFEAERWLADAREVLTAHRTLLPMPEDKEQLFFTDASGGNGLAGIGILHKALSGQQYHIGASLFQNKLGENLFSDRVSIVGDRTGEELLGSDFFDCEGTMHEGDKVAFIENGVFKELGTDKKYAALLGRKSTGCAGGAYDDAPSISPRSLRVASTGETLRELTAGKDAIYLCTASGGDWTDEGNFATPVQCAYLYRDGKLVGRLPEFTYSVSLNHLLGDGFVGSSRDKYLSDRMIAFHASIL